MDDDRERDFSTAYSYTTWDAPSIRDPWINMTDGRHTKSLTQGSHTNHVRGEHMAMAKLTFRSDPPKSGAAQDQVWA